MRRIVLLAIVFIMGYIFIIMPMPVLFVSDVWGVIGSLIKHILSLVGLVLMIYCCYESIKLLQKTRSE